MRDLPWITEGAIEFLKDLVSQNSKINVLEFGCGSSTLWFSNNVESVTSVENDKIWYNKVKDTVEDKKNVNLILLESNAVKNSDELEICYSDVVDRFEDQAFDLILIDGRSRINCFKKAVRLLKRGGFIMLDNSERPEYKEIFDFYKDNELFEYTQTKPDSFGVFYEGWKTSWWRRQLAVENLIDYYENINSQRGEDGIIREIMRRINVKSGNFVEFGANDGQYASNTKELLNYGWSGCFIEPDKLLFSKIEALYKDNKNVTCVNAFVESEGENSFDNLMKKHFDKPIDLISIDIDGEDYEVFKSIKKYMPKLFIIECNPYRNPLDKKYYGNKIPHLQESLCVFDEFARTIGYRMLCYTQNAFFIKKEYYKLFNVSNDLMEMFVEGMKLLIKYEDKDIFNRMIYRMEHGYYGELDASWLKDIYDKIKI